MTIVEKAMKEPKTPAEWQKAVDAAHVMRVIADCEMYGLITGPKVNVARCDDILERGKALGYSPSPGIVEKTFRG